MKIVRLLGLICILALLLGMAGWLGIKTYFTEKFSHDAKGVISAFEHKENPDLFVKEATQYVFGNFAFDVPENSLLLRLRFLLTDKRLPEFLRLEDGVVEFYTRAGMCDNAVRFLSFLLKQEGYSSVQWNMLTPTRGHSVLLVNMPDGRQILADPFYGYISSDKVGRLLDIKEVKAGIKAGKTFQELLIPLGGDSKPGFYLSFDQVTMAAQGDPMTIETTSPLLHGQTLEIGQVDHQDNDVLKTSMEIGFHTIWNYVGHRYDRNWIRVLKAQEPVRVTFTLLSEPHSGVITSEPSPHIDGNKLFWELDTGDEIHFFDGKAKTSPVHMKSYIGVDQVMISQQGDTSAIR